MKEMILVFIAVFIAELGDKTQVATFLFSADKNLNPVWVFCAASLALICSSFLAVLLGSQLGHFISPEKINWIAGGGFITIGVWTLFKAGQGG